MVVQVPEQLAERLNALMRPGHGVVRYAVSAGILSAIADAGSEEKRVAALAYVFENKPFASWSGPETPASAYPSVPDFDGRERAALEEAVRDDGFTSGLFALGVEIAADRSDVPERARRAWAFLTGRCPTPVAKNIALFLMLEDESPFLSFATPLTDVRFNGEIPDEEYRGILWRNRATIARLTSISGSTAMMKTKTAFGDAVLSAISEIQDEHERAAVLGFFLNALCRVHEVRAMAIKLPLPPPAKLKAIMEAAEKGNPCPNCGEVHEKQGEAHEDE